MTRFERARSFAGMTNNQLAEAMGVTTGYTSQLASGVRRVGANAVARVAELMDVDAAWLLDVPQSLPVIDPVEGKVLSCEIMRSEQIPDYGALYHVLVDEMGTIIPVIVGNGVQFTPADWTTPAYHPRRASEIGGIKWMDHRGADAVMLDGLPRTIT